MHRYGKARRIRYAWCVRFYTRTLNSHPAAIGIVIYETDVPERVWKHSKMCKSNCLITDYFWLWLLTAIMYNDPNLYVKVFVDKIIKRNLKRKVSTKCNGPPIKMKALWWMDSPVFPIFIHMVRTKQWSSSNFYPFLGGKRFLSWVEQRIGSACNF